jgi:ribosomal protein S18 acetylase RimI-like enzyme
MLSIRAATLADLETVVALRLTLLREEHDCPIYGRVRADAVRRARHLYRAQLESPVEVTLLAERDGVARGILRCVESNGHPLLDPDRYAYVSSVYVVPEARRAGVVRALLDRASQWCRDRGLDEMRLHSAAGSTTANAAWDALGFRVVEHLRRRAVPAAIDERLTTTRADAPATPRGHRVDPIRASTRARIER